MWVFLNLFWYSFSSEKPTQGWGRLQESKVTPSLKNNSKLITGLQASFFFFFTESETGDESKPGNMSFDIKIIKVIDKMQLSSAPKHMAISQHRD